MVNPAHRHQDLASIPTELLESGDEAACFGSQGLRIAILAGIDYRTVGPVDEVHNGIPELRELRMQANCARTRQGDRAQGGRSVQKLVQELRLLITGATEPF